VSAPDPVDIAAANLGLVRGQHTDPELLERVLRDDLLLGDFEPFTERVAPLLASPQPLDPMLERIQDAIRHRQPAVLAFLEAHASDLSVPDEAAQVVTRMVHHTYLLEELAQAIVASPSFLEALHAHVHALREIFGLREGRYKFIWVEEFEDDPEPRTLLFDLEADPEEKHNLAGEMPELAAEFHARVTSLRRGYEAVALTTGTAEPDAEARALLEKLGYVEEEEAEDSGDAEEPPPEH